MEVQVRVQVRHVELPHRLRMPGGDVPVADVFANDGAVLAFLAPSEDGMFTLSPDKDAFAASLLVGVVLSAVGPALGELDQQVLQQDRLHHRL